MPAPGTRPEYTPLKDHYQVFIRVEPTIIDGATWSLPIMGAVENPMTLTIDDIRNNYESMNHYVTLSCISGRLGTDLISTTQWTGVSMQKILADAKVRGSAKSLFIKSGDGFFETVPLDEIADDERSRERFNERYRSSGGRDHLHAPTRNDKIGRVARSVGPA